MAVEWRRSKDALRNGPWLSRHRRGEDIVKGIGEFQCTHGFNVMVNAKASVCSAVRHNGLALTPNEEEDQTTTTNGLLVLNIWEREGQDGPRA